ncbi:MAG: type II toxin-antitoxin system RelE/ParE family toxin [Pseudomonadota bacterium]
MIVNWTEPALDNLDAIYEYISHDAPVYAQNLIDDLMAAVDRLEQFPDSGRRVPEARTKDIEVREVIARGHRILYYKVNAERLDIIGVRSGHQDLTLPSNQPWESH